MEMTLAAGLFVAGNAPAKNPVAQTAAI